MLVMLNHVVVVVIDLIRIGGDVVVVHTAWLMLHLLCLRAITDVICGYVIGWYTCSCD